jgi:hypothetical protein
VYPGESQPTFLRNIAPPSSGWEKQTKQETCCLLHSGLLLGLLVDPEDGGDMFFQKKKVCRFSPDGKALYARRYRY